MSKVENIMPYGEKGDVRHKGEQVRDMFDNIAPTYDLMNRMMTLGIDRLWRRRCVRIVRQLDPSSVLDLATGTGDLAIALAKAVPAARITGGDLSEGMLSQACKKAEAEGAQDRIVFQTADALDLPFPDNSFDAITIAFGVRNFEHLERGYAEMLRILRPRGTLLVLELTPPSSPIVKPFYRFYTRGIIPIVGKLVSKDSSAYAYLPESIAAVPARKAMTDIMLRVGFTNTKWKNLTAGVATIYTATK